MSLQRPHPLVPVTLLVAASAFDEHLPAERVTAAIARGLRAGGRQSVDELPLAGAAERGGERLRELLVAARFDERLRTARALIVAAECLRERTLAASATFELATRARQRGVPAYAVTAHSALDSFDARMLDLQLIVSARGVRGLSAAGRRLAGLV